MVFARYVMFSEVYWHHAVRAATCMLQRAVWLLRDHIDVPHLIRMDDRTCIQWLQTAARGTPTEPLVEGLFGASRGHLAPDRRGFILLEPERWRGVKKWDAAAGFCRRPPAPSAQGSPNSHSAPSAQPAMPGTC